MPYKEAETVGAKAMDFILVLQVPEGRLGGKQAQRNMGFEMALTKPSYWRNSSCRNRLIELAKGSELTSSIDDAPLVSPAWPSQWVFSLSFRRLLFEPALQGRRPGSIYPLAEVSRCRRCQGPPVCRNFIKPASCL